MSNLIFLDQDKKVRAEDVYSLLTGKRAKLQTSLEHENYLRERHSEILKEQGVDLKKASKDEVIVAIYKNLGGAVRTEEQDKKIKAKFKKLKAFAKAEKEEEEGVDADGGGNEDEDE